MRTIAFGRVDRDLKSKAAAVPDPKSDHEELELEQESVEEDLQ